MCSSGISHIATCDLASCLVTGHQWRVSFFLCSLPGQVSVHIDLNSSSSLSLSSYRRCSSPLNVFMAIWCTLSRNSISCTGSPATDTALQKCPRWCWVERKNHPPLSCWYCLTQHKALLSFSAARPHCWLMFNLVPARTPRSFSGKDPFPFTDNHPAFTPALQGVVLPQVQDLPLLDEFQEIPVSPFLQHFSQHPSECQHNCFVRQSLLLVLHHLQTCWGHTLRCLGHLWRC